MARPPNSNRRPYYVATAFDGQLSVYDTRKLHTPIRTLQLDSFALRVSQPTASAPLASTPPASAPPASAPPASAHTASAPPAFTSPASTSPASTSPAFTPAAHATEATAPAAKTKALYPTIGAYLQAMHAVWEAHGL